MESNEIVQAPQSYSFVLGFYGRCPGQELSSDCVPYDMNNFAFRSIVDSVFEVDSKQSNATFAWYKSSLYNSNLNHFDQLQCGKIYYFVISPGSDKIKIDHLFTSASDEINETGARIAEDCKFIEPTPTPTPEKECCADLENSIISTASNIGSENLNGVKVFGFDYGGSFCFDSLDLTYVPSRFNFKDNQNNVFGYITTTGNFINKTIQYTAPNGDCYEGEAESEIGYNILTKR